MGLINMLLRLLFLITVTGIAANAADIRIAVSDLIADDISETVQMLAEASSVEITVISIGSLPAKDALRLDEIFLAVVATPEGNELLDDTLEVFPFAYSTAVVAVSAANPVNEVSFYDLRSIFGSDSDLSAETWGELGVKNLADRLIQPLIMQDETDISTELFRSAVLKGEAMKLTVNQVLDSEIEEMLMNNVASVAVLPHLPDNEAIKALMISANSQSPAYGPTNDNVYYGDYPIRLSFQIIYKKDHESELVKTLRILMSDEVTESLRANHLFVPPDTIRTSFVNSLDLIE
jgi:ABC-type phosphate transport system substrate-binding protein